MTPGSISHGDELGLFFDLSPDLLCIAGFDGFFKRVNPAWERTLGYTPEELLNRPLLELVHPEDRQSTAAEAQRLQTQGVSGRFENRFRCKDGTYRWLVWMSIALPEQHRIYGIAREKSAAFVRTQETLNAIVHAAPAAIIVLDNGGHVTMWNQGAERIYGWSEEEVLGRPLPYLSEESSQTEFETRAKQVLDGTALTDLTARRRRKNGEEVVVNLSIAPMHDVKGSVCGHVGIAIDVTEQKLLGAQLLRAQRMNSLGALAGGVAHDLNNILAPIAMGIPLLRSKVADSSHEWLFATMETSAQRGADLAKQILTFARGLESDRAPLEIHHVIRELRDVLDQTFSRSVHVVTNIPPGLRSVLANATQLHQLLLNLCINARDAMANGGTLTVTAKNIVLDATHLAKYPKAKPGIYVTISVTDTGSGISEEILQKIFEPFFTTKPVGKGTGLGLSTTLGIVSDHGGFIDVVTAAERGTTFTVYLPATTANHASMPNPGMIPMGREELILLVDDEAAVRNIARATLEANNYRVLTAGDGSEGISAFIMNQDKIQLVICDNNMPVMDGATMLRAIERLKPGTRVISASGDGAGQRISKNFLNKPFTADQLLKVVGETLAI